MRWPSIETGRPASKPMTTSRASSGASSGSTVIDQAPLGAWFHGSSSTPHSMARPHTFSSIEYGDALVASTGMPCAWAYSISELRVVRFQLRTGPRMSSVGSSALHSSSKRTWSLPLPVQPWATATAPSFWATLTRWRQMAGRDRALSSGYLFSYMPLA